MPTDKPAPACEQNRAKQPLLGAFQNNDLETLPNPRNYSNSVAQRHSGHAAEHGYESHRAEHFAFDMVSLTREAQQLLCPLGTDRHDESSLVGELRKQR